VVYKAELISVKDTAKYRGSLYRSRISRYKKKNGEGIDFLAIVRFKIEFTQSPDNGLENQDPSGDVVFFTKKSALGDDIHDS